MKRRIISSLLAIILMISVVAVGASAAAAVDLSDYTASDSTVDFHIKEIYSRIDVAEYRALDEVVAYANALKSAAVNGTSVSDISISWNGSEYGLEEFCDEIVFPVIPMGSGARKAADAVMNNSSLWPLGTPVKDISQTVYDSASYTEVYNLWKHLRDDHKDGFLSVAEFVAEKAQLETKIKALKMPSVGPVSTLKLAGANVSLQESISLFFAIDPACASEYTDLYVEFKKGDVVTTSSETVNLGGRTCFRFSNIAAKEVNDTITVTLYGTFNGKVYKAEEYSYSVATYCYNRLAKSSDAKFKRVCVDLLNYGAAAQTYFSYNTENLANAALTDEQKAFGSTEYSALTDNRTNSGEYTDYGVKAFNLVYEEVIKVLVAVEAKDLNGVVAKVTLDGKVYEIASSEFTPLTIGGVQCYAFYFTKILPNQTRSVFSVTLEKDGVAVGNTMTYSIESYLARQIPRTTNAAYKDLMESTAKYSDACVAMYG